MNSGANELRQITTRLAALRTTWPMPLRCSEARQLLAGPTPNVFAKSDQLVRIRLKTISGLGSGTALPGNYAFDSATTGAVLVGTLLFEESAVVSWRMDCGRGVLSSAVFDDQAAYDAQTFALFFIAVTSTAAAAGVTDLAILARLSSPDAIAGLGHSFGSSIESIVHAADWLLVGP